MPRRTKEEAEATRQRLLDAAEVVFHRQGVARTSLQDIAQAAGATRGAIYWHFRDKSDLYTAMVDRVSLPLEHAMLDAVRGGDPLVALREVIMAAFRRTVHDPRTRRVFEVATHKVEYVDELSAIRDRHLRIRGEWLGGMRRALQAAARAQGVRLPVPARTAAQGLHALVDGLIQNWLLDTTAFDLPRVGRQTLDSYLAGLGLAGGASRR